MEFFPDTLSRLESDAMVERLTDAIATKGWGLWAVEVKRKHRFIGFVGLNVPLVNLPFQPCVEVGWRLDYPYWGQGYATEAAKAVIAFGFETLELEKIVSFTAIINKRSEAVMKKLGMRRCPETFLHPSIPKGHKLQEHCLYKLLKTNWNDQN